MLVGAYGASRVLLSNRETTPPLDDGMIRIGNGGMVSTGSMPIQMPATTVIKPSRSINSPVHSPDGRFIAFQLSKNRGMDSTHRHGVIDASSGKVVSVSEEANNYAAPVWVAPRTLLAGYYEYNLVKEGATWRLKQPGTPPIGMLGARPAAFNRPSVTNVSPETMLRHADLALWFLQAPNSGSGHIGASSLSTGQEIALPPALSSMRNSIVTNYAAPAYKAGGARLLAELYPVPNAIGEERLEVWNLSANKRLFGKSYKGAGNASLHWTRDGHYLIVSGIELNSFEEPKPGASFRVDRRVDIFDARAGKLLSTQEVSLQSGSVIGGDPIVVSDDGQYFLTRRTTGQRPHVVQKDRIYRLVICSLATGKVLSTFERSREFEQLPHFAQHDSRQLVWAAKDTIFLQPWKPSKAPQKLAPRRFKLNLNAPMFG